MGDKDDPNNPIKKQRYLSYDLIIEEILTRLPVKSVLRFKSVSKQWYSTLSSSNFANAHLMRSPFSHPSAPVNTLFIKSDNNYYLFSYNDDDNDHISGNFEDNLVKLNPNFLVDESHIEITGSCNGLICLTQYSSEDFIIWNPSTRKLHKYASHGYFECVDKVRSRLAAPGFGYVSSVDDYKYVQILHVYQDAGYTISDCIVCIFSMRENRWRKIDFGKDPLNLVSRAMLVSEKLYWSAQSDEDRNLLVSFDLGVERFDVIKIDGDESRLLGVMGGCLSKCNYRETFAADNYDKFLHIMEPPTIVKSIGLPKGLTLDVFSEMIGFTKTGKYFVTGPFSNEVSDFPLGIVDTCTKPMQYTTLLRFNKSEIEIARYVPSLVSPFPIEEP